MEFQTHPLLVEYLGEELKDLAIERHAKVFSKQADKAIERFKPSTTDRDKHVDSPYLLKGLLRSREHNAPMTGKLCGPVGKTKRYYTVSRAWRKPKTGSTAAKLIPAEPLERAVLGVIKDVLADATDVRERIGALENERRKSLGDDRERVEPLLVERADLEEKLLNTATLGPASRRLIQVKLDQWETRLLNLEARIAKAQAPSEASETDVEGTVEAVVARLARLGESLDGMPPAAVRKVLATLVSRLEVDQATRAVELELALPSDVFAKAELPHWASWG